MANNRGQRGNGGKRHNNRGNNRGNNRDIREAKGDNNPIYKKNDKPIDEYSDFEEYFYSRYGTGNGKNTLKSREPEVEVPKNYMSDTLTKDFKDMSILERFIKLTSYTQVLGEESELEPYLPTNVEQDQIGNYYLKVGESDTMFTCHLDTASSKKKKVCHVVEGLDKEGEQVFVSTDGSSVLGADDRTGLVIMLHMIEKNVPGLYYFFIGEERGTVGSSGIVRSQPEFFKSYKKCISFDRRGYGSVITRQMGGNCCSSEFGAALVAEISKHSRYKHAEDPTGIYTDSAVFTGIIPECTNLSVGYFNEHSEFEYQNITYLERMCDTFAQMDWESLPIERIIREYDNYNVTKKDKQSNSNRENTHHNFDQQLLLLFTIVEGLMEEVFDMECLNGFGFVPEKEMVFEDWHDADKVMTVFIHDDGSITIGPDHFTSLSDLEEKVKLYYDYDMTQLYDKFDLEGDGEEEEDDDDDEVEIDSNGITHKRGNGKIYNDDGDIEEEFEDGLNMNKFLSDCKKLLNGKSEGNINVMVMNTLLDKYNRTVGSLIEWIFHNKNDRKLTNGLIWDTEDESFYYSSIPF